MYHLHPQERLNVWDAFDQACENCGAWMPLVVMKRNHREPLAVIRWKDLLGMLDARERKRAAPADDDCAKRARVAETLRSLARELEGASD